MALSGHHSMRRNAHAGSWILHLRDSCQLPGKEPGFLLWSFFVFVFVFVVAQIDFQRLPFLFQSKPTTIELHVVVCTYETSAERVRISNEAARKRTRNEVQRLAREIRPHELTLVFD